ncbi:hypothetical protein [Bradyrhizobium sp. DASA03120]|uniref:hypothetical protein n=1 Tax=Bradyrhizobium sp. SMVTL-02 TaxID=3395917 RepID=UPI003F6FCA68
MTELTRLVTNADPVTGVLVEARATQSKQERGRTARRATSSIAAVMVGASLIGWYFHAELAAYVTRYIGEQDNVPAATAGVAAVKLETKIPSQGLQKADSSARDLALHQQADRAISQSQGDTAQDKQGAVAMQSEVQQTFEKERRRTDALANELASAQQIIEMQVAQANKTRDQATQLSQAAEIGMAELQQSLQKERDRAETLTAELSRTRRDLETQLALSSKAGDEAVQAKKAAESAAAELRQSLQKERDRAETLTAELSRTRRDLEAQLALSSKAGDEAVQAKKVAESATAELRQSLQKEHDRAEALTNELARTRRDLETQLALSSKAGDEAVQAKKAAESATAELRQSLQKEHDRAEALTNELARTRRDLESRLALSSKAGDEAVQVKKAAMSATAELQQSPNKERDRAEASAPGREPTQPMIGARIERASNSQIAQVSQAAEAIATEQPAVGEAAQGSPEAARLLARASALLGQGDIGAARIVLEHAVETGSAQASFMLAETYDPLVLSAWKTHGTRGDVTKARALYAKALAGGIRQAKDRSVALH